MDGRGSNRIRRALLGCAALVASAAVATPALAGTASDHADSTHAAKHKHKHHKPKHKHKKHHKRKTAPVAPAAGAQSAVGNFAAAPFTVQFTASRAAGAAQTAATGQFLSNTTFGGAQLMSVAGPITCLDVVGDRVGLFYPVKTSSPSVLSMAGAGVLFYAQVDSSGKPESASFVPVPATHVSSCAPPALPGVFQIQSGTLTITGG